MLFAPCALARGIAIVAMCCCNRFGRAEPPANDSFQNAFEVFNGAWTFDNSAASTTDSVAGCATHGKDIWFKYQCTCDGILRVTTCGSSFDTVVLLHNGWGQPTNQNLLRCNDNAQLENCSTQSVAEIRVTRGKKILINVSGAEGEHPASGKGRLTISCIAVAGGCCIANDTPGCEHPDCAAAVCEIDPFCCETAWDSDCAVLANHLCVQCSGTYLDDCNHAAAIVNGAYTNVGNFGANTDGPPAPDCGDFQNDQWYNYTATCTGTLTVETSEATFASMLALYEGWRCPPQTLLTCSPRQADSKDAKVSTQVHAGQRIKIRFGGDHRDTGTATLTIKCSPGPDELDPTHDGDPKARLIDHPIRRAGRGAELSALRDCGVLVEQMDSFCCEVGWDELCSDLARDLCGD